MSTPSHREDPTIERLRAALRAVAAATPVAEVPSRSSPRRLTGAPAPAVPSAITVLASSAGRRARWTLVGALAAAALLVGVLVVAGRDAPTVASSLDATRFRHPLLGEPLPEGFGLVEVHETSLVYLSGDGRITLSTVEGTISDRVLVVRGDKRAEWAGPATLVWEEHPGLVVELAVASPRLPRAEIENLAETLVMVTDAAWQRTVESAGFAGLDDVEEEQLAVEWHPAGPQPEAGRRLVGSAQLGVRPLVGCCHSFSVVSFRALGDGIDERATRWLITAPYPATAFEVDEPSGSHPRTPLSVDPGRPTLRTASVVTESVPGTEPWRLKVRFYNAAGKLVATRVGNQ